MSLIKTIRKQIASDLGLTIIRADQPGDVPPLPYATYKVQGDGKGFGREDVSYEDQPEELIETTEEERLMNVTFSTYGTTHDQAYDLSQEIRKWFNRDGFLFLQENGAAVARLSDVLNKTTFLVDAYDEKFGVDVMIRYNETDTAPVDYFDKVEYEIDIDRE